METLKIKNSDGAEVIINKPKKKALAELVLADKEERSPNLPEQDREDAQNFIDWTGRGYSEAKPEAEEKPAKGGKSRTPKEEKKAAEPEAPVAEEGK